MENKETGRANRILSSLEGLQKAGAPDFFYTRLMGRMQQETEPKRAAFFLLRPAFITAALFILFVANIISLTQLGKRPVQAPGVQSEKPATIESFAKAYNLETASVYE